MNLAMHGKGLKLELVRRFAYTGPVILVDILIGALIVLVFVIAVTIIAHLWVKVPFIPTPHGVVQEMVALADLRGDEVVYDLGAGDFRIPIAVKKAYPGSTAIGCEFIPTVWLLGRFRVWRSGEDVTCIRGDALKQDLRDADCIFLYLIPGIMDDLAAKFDRELRPGTTIVSYAFSFPGKEPVTEKTVPWLQGKREIRVYKW